MATYKHLRSSTANKRPTTGITDGQLAINTNTASPGLFFKDSAGTGIVKVGPVHVGTTAPNSTPAAGGSSGNYLGEQWLDTSVSPAQMKVWNGSAWVGIVADELPVSKLQDGAARQLLQTDAAGTGVEWTSNVDVPGTLDVTSTATFDSIASHPLGSAGAPTITFTGDPNTGIYSPGADQVAVSTGGTGRLFVDASGRVGIGTTSPGQALEVAGNISFTANTGSSRIFGPPLSSDTTLVLRAGSSTGEGANIELGRDEIIYTDADQHLFRSRDGSSERARIDSSGRLLVGASSARSNFYNASASAVSQVEGTDNNGSALSIVQNVNGVAGNGAVLFLGRSDGSALGSNTLVPADRSIGRVSYQANDGTEFVEAARIEALVDGTPGANDMPGRLVFSTTADGASSPTERLRITSAGLVGVGTSSPSKKLEIANGDVRLADGYTISWGDDTYRIFRNGSQLRFDTNGSQALTIDQDGTITFNAYGAGTLSTNASGVISASDGRYKTKTRQIENGLEAITALNPTYYKWNEDSPFASEHEELGFVAQEVAAVIPEASPGEDEENKYRNYHDRAIIAMLVKGMQEQQNIITALTARVAALEAN